MTHDIESFTHGFFDTDSGGCLDTVAWYLHIHPLPWSQAWCFSLLFLHFECSAPYVWNITPLGWDYFECALCLEYNAIGLGLLWAGLDCHLLCFSCFLPSSMVPWTHCPYCPAVYRAFFLSIKIRSILHSRNPTRCLLSSKKYMLW